MVWERRSITLVNINAFVLFFSLIATNATPNNPHTCNALLENAPTADVVGLFDKYLNIFKYGILEAQESGAANKFGLGNQVVSSHGLSNLNLLNI